MLDKNEKPYLDALARPAQIELPNGTREYLYHKHKYRHLAEALIARQKTLQLREEQLPGGITEDLVRRAEAEISRRTNRTLFFSGPLLSSENTIPQDHEQLSKDESAAGKVFGFILIAAGAFAMLYGASMDTSVAAGQFGRVHNLDLANQQRNILIVGAVGVIAGLVLLAMGQLRGNTQRTGGSQSPSPETTKKCPACAEAIKKEARLCRFCGTQQADTQD